MSFPGHRGLLEGQEEPLINYDHYYHHLARGINHSHVGARTGYGAGGRGGGGAALFVDVSLLAC